MDVWDGRGNIVLDTSIYNDKGIVWRRRDLKNHIIEFLHTVFDFVFFFIY